MELFSKEYDLSYFTMERPVFPSKDNVTAMVHFNYGYSTMLEDYAKTVIRVGGEIAGKITNCYVEINEAFKESINVIAIENGFIVSSENDGALSLEIEILGDENVDIVYRGNSPKDGSYAVGYKKVPMTGYTPLTFDAAKDNITDSEGETFEPMVKYIFGDVNRDGSVSMADLVLLSEYLLGKKVTFISDVASDMQIDGTIDNFDLVALRKKITRK